MLVLSTDIRMAGYDPTNSGTPTIVDATKNSIHLTIDYNANGTIENESGNPFKEDISYSLDTSTQQFKREIDSIGYVADHIEYLEFYYEMEDDSFALPTVSLPNPEDIRSIHISILARSRIEDPDYTNNIVYQTAGGANPVNGTVGDTTSTYADGYRRRMLTTTVKCRNMGL